MRLVYYKVFLVTVWYILLFYLCELMQDKVAEFSEMCNAVMVMLRQYSVDHILKVFYIFSNCFFLMLYEFRFKVPHGLILDLR